jgi:hypothetical protein
MDALGIYPSRVEDLTARISALSASARPANRQETYENGKGKGLLRWMYPGLSCEQAAAVVHQEIMVEKLRKVARSRERRLAEPPSK